jgi:hypothetical protein
VNRGVLGFIGAVILSSAGLPTEAHHGTSVTYDTSKTITVSGTVTEWVFGFPHSQIYFDVLDPSGTVMHWGAELGPTPSMMKKLDVGWNKDSIKAGDKLNLVCNPHKVPGSTACLSKEIYINGKLLPLNMEQIDQAKKADAAH